MACTWIERDEVFERYGRGALSPTDRDAFEEHYFACQACFDKLRTYAALKAELAASPAPVVLSRTARARAWRWVWVPAGVAIVVVVTALWLGRPGTSTPRSAQVAAAPSPSPAAAPSPAAPVPTPAPAATPAPIAVAVLARVQPPVYIPVALRGPRDDAAEVFEAAMRHYADGDFARAIPGLREAAGARPNAAQYVFFLAICNLLTGRLQPAITGLEKTIALGESPYLEEAHFYVAKARLQLGDIGAAREALKRTVARHGRLEGEARALLVQLEALSQGKNRPPGS